MVRKIVASAVLAVGLTATAVAVPASAAPVKGGDSGGVSATCAMCWPEPRAK